MNGKRKVLIIAILFVMVAALGSVALYYWYNGTYFVSTEDATVTGDLVKVSPQISGKLLEFDVKEGSRVVKDQILGRVEMDNLSDSIDQSAIRAPIDGIVIKKQGIVGEIESVGQTLAVLVDPKTLYINANIEEKKLGRIHPGQTVDITIDQFEGEKFTGTVNYVGQASNSTFSLLPSSTSGTFTKVVQKIPVRIEFDQHDEQLLPGTNSLIKIHVK
ncbi:efflux RND transporter periplasmic adaptor subunit [Desulfosporosinus sp. BG]|uniref:HlyD family secretion protein n=1 Tax=Desulfosporosinus sp. BG TaxID=1633135 RepID=UPI00083B109A|nr:efflux RND transporter periplasmic adaptor subunit [Desulfosporosinus sp. BG]ODA40641.1 multidrug efflux system protein [Desulfosporosinus sp. BG]